MSEYGKLNRDCRFIAFLRNFGANFSFVPWSARVFFRWIHSNGRVCCLSAALLTLACAGGCAFFDADRWKLDHLRDERAVDIERRLERTEPIVKNPF